MAASSIAAWTLPAQLPGLSVSRTRFRAAALHPRAAASSSSSSWRPAKADVERLSRGQPAKHRGTGSRAVPHRLNADEQAAFTRARESHGFLTVRGSGARRERKGAPLINTWRMWSDAERRAAVVLHLGTGSQRDPDVVIVDLATMRKEGWGEEGVRGMVGKLGELVNESLGTAVAAGEDEGLDERVNSEDVEWRKAPTWRLPNLDVYWEFGDRAQAKAAAKAVSRSSLIDCGWPTHQHLD